MWVFPLKSKQMKQQTLEIWPEFSTRQFFLSPAEPCWEVQACPRRGWGVPSGSEATCLPTQPFCEVQTCRPSPAGLYWQFLIIPGTTEVSFSFSGKCLLQWPGLTHISDYKYRLVLMALLCPHSLCLKGWGRNRIGGDCLLGQAPKIKGIWTTSGITALLFCLALLCDLFLFRTFVGGCKYIACAIVTLEMRGPMSLCLGLSTVVCTGCWCSHGGLCCWALLSSSLGEGKEKLWGWCCLCGTSEGTI